MREPIRGRKAPSWSALFDLAFRPLYLLGCGWAIVSVLLWVFSPHLITGEMKGVAWHAHEMLWGFIATIAVGFLLTAAATWTARKSISGLPLAGLCVAWIIARVGYLLPGLAAFWTAATAESVFFGGVTWTLGRMIYAERSQRNYGVPLLALGLGVTNGIYLWHLMQLDYGVLMQWFHVGLLVMVILALLIGRRVIPFFAMRAIRELQIPMQAASGRWQMALMLMGLVFSLLGNPSLAGLALATVGGIALWQLATWRPTAVLHHPLLWVLYTGYGGLAAGLMLASATFSSLAVHSIWSVHLIGIGGFSVLIIGMVTRTALGHTGRKLAVDWMIVSSFVLVILAAIFRLAAFLPTALSLWLTQVSAMVWAVAFGCYLYRFSPILIRPR